MDPLTKQGEVKVTKNVSHGLRGTHDDQTRVLIEEIDINQLVGEWKKYISDACPTLR